MLGGRALKAVIPGGISAKVLTAAEIQPLKLDQAVFDAAGYATIAILDKFRDEFEYFIANKRSRCAGVLEVGHA
jgi:NADH:ubiquinone oxidoreductase subunit F (NADH-binding)